VLDEDLVQFLLFWLLFLLQVLLYIFSFTPVFGVPLLEILGSRWL
jgi:hypothetical protein